ncbi:hypothetical protein M0R45_001720 [Rubus argutus]|uniref:Uncharacterized protein n=1 Tax=Rubus argutus TaxID=59490 RepID=A0AAW1VK95_RUBAR
MEMNFLGKWEVSAKDMEVKNTLSESLSEPPRAIQSHSIAELESEPGLFLSNKEKLFSEAELMAKKYRQKLPAVLPRRSETPQGDSLPFDRLSMYANWKWFKFEKE